MQLQLTTREFVEELVGSKGRVKILRALVDSGELNISQICRKVGMNYTAVDRNILILEDMGLIRQRWYGKIRMIDVTFDEFSIRFKRQHGIDIKIASRERLS